ncbi:nuclear transport factor 2 family protein [Solimonas soli]|uniref:nuclear transport factor 2 family protein n=1 Tax=Solimonas soli TaxID=413479 RepID=UPI0004893F65|nr:nuclear transport factor 2 family protein [Solimonas soli]
MSRERIESFYCAFRHRDAAGMSACYHDDARFSDPVFPDLDAGGVRAMWSMLLSGAKDLRIEFGGIDADAQQGRAHWDAWYTFSATGRPVRNHVETRFEFRDGLILVQRDAFDFHRWATQALGLTGRLLGGTAFLQRKLQAQAAQRLAQWRQRKG